MICTLYKDEKTNKVSTGFRARLGSKIAAPRMLRARPRPLCRHPHAAAAP